MAFSLLSLLDDVASLLDDVAVMTKVAAKKTSGVIGDDLALNAQQLEGIDPNQELPIIYAVAKGGFINKVILVPIALLISAFAPFLITPLLMIGGVYLCFEGVEKIIEKFFIKKVKDSEKIINTEDKIKGAIKTDFILSAEIIVIALGTMNNSPIMNQIIALSLIGLLMNFGVYGVVALIIKIDDLGLFLQQQKNKLSVLMGRGLIFSAPVLMKFLGIAGTTAMFLVGGGILSHGIHTVGNLISSFANDFSSPLSSIIAMTGDFIVGITAGFITVALLELYKKVRN